MAATTTNSSNNNSSQAPTPCELNDLEWTKFKADFNISNWDSNRVGQRRIGVALVGLGRIGLVHLRNLLRVARANLLYAFDIDQARLDACAKSMFFREFHIQALSSQHFQRALADPQVGAVIVASPTQSHEQLVRLSLEAGKCVLCEKPLTLNQPVIMQLYELAQARKLFLSTGFNRHYDSDWQRMRARAKANALGPIQLVRIVSRNGQRPTMNYLKVSGNLFYDTAIHDLDMMLWMVRQLPTCVQVLTKSWHQFLQMDEDFKRRLSDEELAILPQINDYFMVLITLQFADGSLGVIDTSRYSSYGNDQRCEVYGSKGMLKCDGQYSSQIHEFNPSGISQPGIKFTFESRYAKAYENELADFITMADLARSGIYENRAQVAGYLSDFPRGTLVAAATKVAEACTEAANSKQAYWFEWPQEFRRKFYEEIEL